MSEFSRIRLADALSTPGTVVGGKKELDISKKGNSVGLGFTFLYVWPIKSISFFHVVCRLILGDQKKSARTFVQKRVDVAVCNYLCDTASAELLRACI
jgi:hypothetical protein